jgi:tripartite-type tricarboxylate transporter receptor subunit TctC
MNFSRRELLRVAGGAAALCAMPRHALAQGYPARPIRLVVPFPPGGVYDTVGRPLAERVGALLGTIVIENQGGAGGSLGTAAVARAQPDGYTLLLSGGGPIAVTPTSSRRPPYDPTKDLEAIYLVVVNAAGFAVHPSVPVRNLKELADYAKANPGKLSYASAGVGSLTHLAGELFKSVAGVRDIVHVPYRGMGPALKDLISGEVPLALPIVTGQILALHKAGKIRLLAVTTKDRLASAPDVPTAVEAGYDKMIAQGFIALFAPAKTPETIINRVSEVTRKAMSEAEFQRFLIASGLEPQLDSNPDKTRRFVQEEIARWAPIINTIGLKTG